MIYRRGPDGLLDGVRGQIGQEMAGQVCILETVLPFLSVLHKMLSLSQLWHAGRQSTQRLINTYAHIDILRPYFDVEPAEFRDRYSQKT